VEGLKAEREELEADIKQLREDRKLALDEAEQTVGRRIRKLSL